MTDLERQIVDELHRLGERLGALLGLDIADQIAERARSRAPMIAGQLAGTDRHIAAETAIDVMAVLWPDADPPRDWWTSPLGRAVVQTTTVGSVSKTDAAAMLGVTQGRVTQLLAAGKLDQDGGAITRASIATRLRGQ